jgi:serine phosphatase RsbU (regulator of sigma subunit)
VPERQQLPIEGTMAGRAFRRVEAVASTVIEGTYRMWLPLLDGAERLGVVELDLAREPSDELMDDIQALVTLAAELVVANHACSDVFSRLRRCKTLSLAAEMQWELLPPLTFATERGRHRRRPGARLRHRGDSFDYAVNGSTADLAIFGSVGHGLPAAVLASVAVPAYRHARRGRADLPDIAAEINTTISGQFGASQFVTALLASLDLDTGRLRWVNAGHPEPLVLRGMSLVQLPHRPTDRPFGLQEQAPSCHEARLEPGDRELLHTDGITEARSPDGTFFGEQRLADFVTAAVAAAESAPETLRRLMRGILVHQADQLQDDASLVVLGWLTGDAHRLHLPIPGRLFRPGP